MKLTFLGANSTVTGSKYLLEANNEKILIDCGLFQGIHELRAKNWEKFYIEPNKINEVILTHAHIDHSGYLPLLIKNGFTGQVYCSYATLDLCSILLPDSGYLQEEEARMANKYSYSKHKPAFPLYTKDDAISAMKYFSPIDFGKDYSLKNDIVFQLNRAGHILGSSLVTIKEGNTSILFSGDLGRPYDHIIKPPAIVHSADYLVIESTYGDRLHDKADPADKIGEIISNTVKRGGVVIIPSFAVGRAQSILYYIAKLKNSKKIPGDIPVYLDSPMAISANKIMQENSSEHHLTTKQCEEICTVATYVNTVEESKVIDQYKTPMIIISASGMATGGRVLHHLKLFAKNPLNTILFVGFQSEGTRGARLINGERELKIYGEIVHVAAQVELITNTSAHSDYEEILNWLRNFTRAPRKVFITHGEPNASQSLKEKIEKNFGWSCSIPKYLQTEVL